MSDGAPRAPGHIRLSALARAIRSDRQGSNWGALVCARDHAWPLLDARHRSAEAKQADSRAASSNCIDHGVAPPGSLGSTLLSHARGSRAERNVALPERTHMQRAHISPTRSQLRRLDGRQCLRVPAQGGEGCSMATRAAVARLPTRPERPGQLGAAHGAAAERHRHA